MAPFGMSTVLRTEVQDDKTMWVLRDPTQGREGSPEMVSCRDDLEALDLELGFCLGLGHGEDGKVVLDFEGGLCLGLGLVGDDQLVLGLEEAPYLSHHRN